jgi:hypothetical protein
MIDSAHILEKAVYKILTVGGTLKRGQCRLSI